MKEASPCFHVLSLVALCTLQWFPSANTQSLRFIDDQSICSNKIYNGLREVKDYLRNYSPFI